LTNSSNTLHKKQHSDHVWSVQARRAYAESWQNRGTRHRAGTCTGKMSQKGTGVGTRKF